MPRDSASTVQTFIPDRPEVKVVSFQWWTDVPDRSLKPFTPAVRPRMLLQADPHVKSVIRLDDALTQVRTHTARISAGTRLLVREPFPLFDELRQQWGSLVPAQVLENQPAELPEAFVLHAINRSESEYVARLAMGMRQVRYEATLKTNRKGYVASARPQVPFSPPRSAWRSYRRSLKRFHKGLDLERLISKSRDATLARGAELRASLVKDSRRMAQLRIAMRGVNAPELDSEYPGWETASIRAHVDRVVLGDDSIRLHGWAYSVPSLPLEFALFQGDADSTMPLAVTSQERPDVRAAHPEAPLACGYTIEVTPYRPADWSTAALGVRPVGSRLWDRFTLPREALVRND